MRSVAHHLSNPKFGLAVEIALLSDMNRREEVHA